MNNDELLKLAKKAIAETLKVGRDSNLFIKYQGDASKPFAEACRQTAVAQGVPRIVLQDSGRLAIRLLIDKSYKSNNSKKFLTDDAQYQNDVMRDMTHYIQIDDHANIERAYLTEEERQVWVGLYSPVNKTRLERTKWLITDAPTEGFASSCNMSVPEFNKFYMSAFMADYASMKQRIEPLRKCMSGNRDFIVTGNKTYLTGQFADVAAVACVGERNLPDGECFTAPLAKSINGHVLFEKSKYGNQFFPWIYLEIKNGFIVSAKSETDEQTLALNQILDTDEGARQFGEWAIGFNPMINQVIGNILFDEKVSGTMHMAVGKCIDKTPNGIYSKVHWDLIKDQRPNAGGGDIIIDDVLVRRNGLFIPRDLQPLNPENLRLG